MTFQDFIESLFARLRKGVPPGLGVPDELRPLGDYSRIAGLIEEAHIFHLETTAEDGRFLREIGGDVLRDLETTLPCPFDNFGIVDRLAGGEAWGFQWVLRLAKHGSWPPADGGLAENEFLLWAYASDSAQGPPHFHGSVRFSYIGGQGINFKISADSIERFSRLTRRPRPDSIEST